MVQSEPVITGSGTTSTATSVPETDRHDFVLARSSEKTPGAREKQLCEICNVPFDDHYHRLSYLQKVAARSQGKNWNRCSFKERQVFKQIAVGFLASQVQRKLQPFIDSVERGPEKTDTPSPTTA